MTFLEKICIVFIIEHVVIGFLALTLIVVVLYSLFKAS